MNNFGGLIRSLFTWRKTSGSNFTFMLWAPVCDPITQETSMWAREIATNRDEIQALIGSVSRSQIEQALAESPRDAVACFLGHGLDGALIGHPFEYSDNGPAASAVFDASLLRSVPRSLFAYCCDSGMSLGPVFDQTETASFLGFNTKIGVCVSNLECRKTWVKLLQGIVDEIVIDKRISEAHAALLRRLYDEAIGYYRSGRGKDNDSGLLMQMYLTRQKGSLVYFGD